MNRDECGNLDLLAANPIFKESLQGANRMPWYEVVLSREAMAAGTSLIFIEEFFTMFQSARAPEDAALLESHESKGHFYLSPGAATIAMSLVGRYSGKECSAPRRSEVGLSVGHSGFEGIILTPEA
jgi:hypothetical protein